VSPKHWGFWLVHEAFCVVTIMRGADVMTAHVAATGDASLVPPDGSPVAIFDLSFTGVSNDVAYQWLKGFGPDGLRWCVRTSYLTQLIVHTCLHLRESRMTERPWRQWWVELVLQSSGGVSGARCRLRVAQ
jgi:hypothetical protein